MNGFSEVYPAYLKLTAADWKGRVEAALQELEDCRACPRDCGVNRMEDKWSACKTGRFAVVGSFFPHFGEEDCLRGWNGSGTIFFSHCNLRCVFCQNYDISQAVPPGRAAQGSTPEEIARMMLQLQRRGCHNINFVTPEHVVPQVVEALAVAVRQGLRLPVVYNTSAYDSLHSIQLMEGIVDVYMPDFKYWTSESSKRYLKAENYPELARRAIREMQRQVGPLQLDERGLAKRGVLLRHLVMPGALEETFAILEWVRSELGPDAYVNVMDQYFPAGKVDEERFPELCRRPHSSELAAAREHCRRLGLDRLDTRCASVAGF